MSSRISPDILNISPIISPWSAPPSPEKNELSIFDASSSLLWSIFWSDSWVSTDCLSMPVVSTEARKSIREAARSLRRRFMRAMPLVICA